MKKVLLIVAAAALIAGTAFAGSAHAQKRGDRADRAALTATPLAASIMPAAVQRSAMAALRHRFTLRQVPLL